MFHPFLNKPWLLRVCSTSLFSFENTVRKGEIARNEQFLLFPQCFSSNLKLSSANSSNSEETKICRFGQG